MIRRLCALMTALFLTVLWAAAFSDVSQQDWYGDEVEFVFEQGLMNGVSDELFSPHTPVTRGMAVTVLYRLEGSPAVADPSGFPDVGADQWYGDAAAWAKNTGLASGYDTGNFGPNDAVTREQLAVFLWRYADYKGMEIASGVIGGYYDAESVSLWALDGVRHAVGAGLMTGKDGDLLDPGGAATRAELAVILRRLTTPAAG